MRRVLMMLFAVAVLMSLGASAALAQQKPAGCDKSSRGDDKAGCQKPKKCKAGEIRKHGKCVPQPKKCKAGEIRKHGKCVPKPVTCDDGKEKVGRKCVPKPVTCDDDKEKVGRKCVPKPVTCDDGKEKVGDRCVPKPPVCTDDKISVDGKCVPRPKKGPCAKADLVLLEDLLEGTGALLCVYLGDNAPNASSKPRGDCPDALLALPLDKLLGACLFLPPADVRDSKSTSGMPVAPPARTGTAEGSGLPGGAGGAGLERLTSTLTGLLGLR